MQYAWTIHQLAILETTARVSSVFSLLGAGWIILTFSVSPAFQKPINRLAFFAAFGNILTNVATLVSRDSIKLYEAGGSYALCKVQAILIQWFMPADALFCAAMAFNVYLTVFRKYSANQLQRLEIPYILICYGIPFIPAITFTFISKTEGEKKYPLYESATLWCWISNKWQILRIATFYGPIWVVLVFTFVIYILAGRVIFDLRDSLRGFAKESSTERTPNTTLLSNNGDVPKTEVQELVSNNVPLDNSNPGNVQHSIHGRNMSGSGNGVSQGVSQSVPGYSCTVESGGRPTSGISAHITAQRNKMAMEANTAAWAYCRCAMLFFLALVITWTPSSVNRIYTVVYPGAANFGLNFASALVLPCQGLWNGIIYTVTTLPACKELFYILDDNIRKIFGKEPINRRRRRTRHGNNRTGYRVREEDIKRDAAEAERGTIGRGGRTYGQGSRGINMGGGTRLDSDGSSLDSIP